MQKKRKTTGKSNHSRTRTQRDKGDARQSASKWQNLLLTTLYFKKEAVPLATIEQLLLTEGAQTKDLKDTIDSLTHEGLIRKSGKRLLALNRNAPLYEGRLTQHPKGFGFVELAHGQSATPPFSRDPFISISAMANAQHGDQVLIRILRTRKDLRPEAVILTVTARGKDRIPCIFKKDRTTGTAIPDDPRFPFIIRIDDYNQCSPTDGDAVIVQYTRPERMSGTVSGKILEVLGSSHTIDTQMRLVIEKYELPHIFSAQVEKEAANLVTIPEADPAREDLRTTSHITIDGETAKDFDDAICVQKTRKGFRLYVSIADVSYYVSPGSAIDREAYARGTSIYFPGRVIPMLPETLSNDLCSLVPGKDRLTVSAVLDYDRSGTLQGKRFCRSIICSRQRFTYTTVRQILIDKDPDTRSRHKAFLTQLKWAQELATALQARRKSRGSIDFNLPEPLFTLDDGGEVTAIARSERNFAHQLIEECMLAANEAVAELATSRGTRALYRVHHTPDPARIEEFITFAKTLGLQLPPQDDSPSWFARVLDICKDTRYEYIINALLLRSMKQAQYAVDNVGHFGLASADYTHFTSPIRRYPDLIVHRTLLGLLADPPRKQPATPQAPSLNEAGEFLSGRERTAIAAERDMHERLKISFMKNHLGDSYDAIISGVNDSVLFLEIPEHCISGALEIDQLADDCYLLDAKNHRLFGEITGKTYRIGDPVRVTLTGVDPFRKRLSFAPETTFTPKQRR